MSISAGLTIGVAAFAAFSLAACQQGGADSEMAKIDSEIDPALTSALEDQILVDPALTQQSNNNAVRPPESPTQAQYPLPQRSAEVQKGRNAGGGGQDDLGAAECGPRLEYGNDWARRLPPPFALYPGARLAEAAGSDAPDCRMRVATFTTEAASERVLDWYRSRAEQAGYSAERQMRGGDHILAGVNQDGAAYYLILTPRAGGSEVAIISKAG